MADSLQVTIKVPSCPKQGLEMLKFFSELLHHWNLHTPCTPLTPSDPWRLGWGEERTSSGKGNSPGQS